MADLSAVFRPRAIAVVGASDDPVKIGGRPLAFLLRHGYAGRVFPVNPARATVQGLPAFPSICAIPDEVDLAILGAGPAGLAAAWWAARRGLSVAVYERGPSAGGLAGGRLRCRVRPRLT